MVRTPIDIQSHPRLALAMRVNASLKRAMLDLECRRDPFHLRLLQAATAADHVETTRQLRELRMREQIELRGSHQFRTLGAAYRNHAVAART